MSEPSVVNDFLGLLAESKLLSPDEIRAAEAEYGLRDADTPLAAARVLVKHKVLTRYQAERLLAGRVRGFFIDRYKVLEALGFGGMGSLYLAEDVETGQAVALKVLNEANRHDDGMLARLKLEAAAGARLHHDNIVQTISVDDTGAVCYVVMEFVKGISLTEFLQQNGPIPVPQACDLIRQAAAGLQHAHEAGIVHRDVKPDNLLVDAKGNVKLLDFGLALVGGESDSEFSLAMIFGHDCVGTPDYISPEQSIDCQIADARADVYSLGCTLYLLLSAKLPFPEKNGRDKIEGHRKRLPKPLSEIAPWVPPEIETIVKKMMSRRREERYQSMTEVIDALTPFAERRPVNFRFNDVLSQRMRNARARNQLEHPSRVQPRLSSRVATASAVAEAALHREDALDTQVESDTRPSVSGVYRKWMPEESTDAVAGRATSELAGKLPPAVLVSLTDGTRIVLKSNPTVLGRNSECDIPIDLPGISGRHCEFRPEGAWWAVADLGSKNGIVVNGATVKEQMLWPGDMVAVAGKYRFQIIDPTRQVKKSSRKKWPLIAAVTAALAVAGGLAYYFLF